MAASSDENGRISRNEAKPLGIRFVEHARKSSIKFRTYQTIVLVLTFFAYASYHATRKTTSIVKSVLDPEPLKSGHSIPISSYLKYGWAPFNNADGTSLLGKIDVAFLSTYSLGMYFAGHLGDRSNLRIFLTVGMVGTGIFTSLFGAGYWLNIHSFYYYLVIQMLAGVMQSTGWPSVVALVGNWFGKTQRGLIMGIWNAHTSVGNITGSLIASAMLAYGWGWSFVVPGLLITFVGLMVFLFLPVTPEAMGVEEEANDYPGVEKLTSPLLTDRIIPKTNDRPVGFMEAWRIPGVAPFAFCLFFSKLVAYTFLYWLPFYISHTSKCVFSFKFWRFYTS